MFEFLKKDDENATKTLSRRLKEVENLIAEMEGDIASLRVSIAKVNGTVGARLRFSGGVTEKDKVIEALAKDMGLDKYIDLTDDIKQMVLRNADTVSKRTPSRVEDGSLISTQTP